VREVVRVEASAPSTKRINSTRNKSTSTPTQNPSPPTAVLGREEGEGPRGHGAEAGGEGLAAALCEGPNDWVRVVVAGGA
jgi:hypothetical protein